MTTIKYHLIKLLICDKTEQYLLDEVIGWYFQKNDIYDLFVCCLNEPDKEAENISVGDKIVLLAPIEDDGIWGTLPLDEHWEEITDVPDWVIGKYIVP